MRLTLRFSFAVNNKAEVMCNNYVLVKRKREEEQRSLSSACRFLFFKSLFIPNTSARDTRCISERRRNADEVKRADKNWFCAIERENYPKGTVHFHFGTCTECLIIGVSYRTHVCARARNRREWINLRQRLLSAQTNSFPRRKWFLYTLHRKIAT